MNLSKIPNVSPLPLLGVCLASDLVLAAAGEYRAAPFVWAGAGAYSFLKGHPIWGTVFLLSGAMSYSFNKAVMEVQGDPVGPNNDAAVTGPTLLPSPLRGLQAVLSNNAKRSRTRR